VQQRLITSARWVRPPCLLPMKGMAMPKKLERALKKEAEEKGLKGDKADAYVYGTLRKTGWKPKREKK
jgi:hypothetical protein